MTRTDGFPQGLPSLTGNSSSPQRDRRLTKEAEVDGSPVCVDKNAKLCSDCGRICGRPAGRADVKPVSQRPAGRRSSAAKDGGWREGRERGTAAPLGLSNKNPKSLYVALRQYTFVVFIIYCRETIFQLFRGFVPAFESLMLH